MTCAENRDALQYRGIHPNLDLALERLAPGFLSSLGDRERRELRGGRGLLHPLYL